MKCTLCTAPESRPFWLVDDGNDTTLKKEVKKNPPQTLPDERHVCGGAKGLITSTHRLRMKDIHRW